MDISSFFGKQKKINPVVVEDQDKKRDFGKLLGGCLRDKIIDISDYRFMMDSLKKGKSLTYYNEYNRIYNLCTNNLKGDILARFEGLFHHYYGKIMDVVSKGDLIIDDMSENEKFIYTEDQRIAIRNIRDFLVSKDMKTYGLYGFAGTGKTTLISKIVIYLLKNNLLSSVVLAAPTNKANNVLKSKFRLDVDKLIDDEDKDASFNDILDRLEDNGSKINFLTIHKLLTYKNDFDLEGERIFVKSGRATFELYDLVIVDECSMLSTQIITHLFEEINKKGRVRTPKVLFVGDPAQLPPVNENKSIIFNRTEEEFNLEEFKKSLVGEKKLGTFMEDNDKAILDHFDIFKRSIIEQKSSLLQEVVRNSNNKVVSVCNEVRSWVMGDINKPRLFPYASEKVYIYKKDKDKLKTDWFKRYMSYVTNNSDKSSSIILTWTNRQTDIYNETIREMIFKKGRDNMNKYEISDVLILTDFYTIKESEMDENKESLGRFYTSEQIKVVNYEEIIRGIVPFIEQLPIKKRLTNHADIADKYAKCVRAINKETTRKYNALRLYVHKLNDEVIIEEEIATHEITVLKDESKDRLENDKKTAANKIKELRIYLKNMHKEHSETLDSQVIRHLWREWSKRFVEPFANVNYGNSITCHKAQGSNYCNVFIDADDMLLNKKDDEAKRCIYTAMTRPSNELHILI